MLLPEHIVKLVFKLRARIDGFLVNKIEKAGAKGLMVSHGNILVQLYREDKQPMAKIAAEIGKCKSTVTALVDKLEKADFVKREINSDDIRVKNLCLTEKGKTFQKEFWNISSDLNSILWEGFDAKEQELFLSYLDRMDKNVLNALEASSGVTNCK